MRREPPASRTKEARTQKARRTRQPLDDHFEVGQTIPVVHRASNGFETRGPATILDINPNVQEWGSPLGLVYVRFPTMDNHVFELDYSRGRGWHWRRVVSLDRDAS